MIPLIGTALGSIMVFLLNDELNEKLEKILSLDQRFNKINEYFKVNLTLNEKPKIKEKKFIKFDEGTSFLSLIEVQDCHQ